MGGGSVIKPGVLQVLPKKMMDQEAQVNISGG
jgi:hypothetical protein